MSTFWNPPEGYNGVQRTGVRFDAIVRYITPDCSEHEVLVTDCGNYDDARRKAGIKPGVSVASAVFIKEPPKFEAVEAGGCAPPVIVPVESAAHDAIRAVKHQSDAISFVSESLFGAKK